MPVVKEEEVYVIPGSHLINTTEQLDSLSEHLCEWLSMLSAEQSEQPASKEEKAKEGNAYSSLWS